MIDKPKGCSGCTLEHLGHGFVPFTPKGPILMVGEQPAPEDIKSGRVFSGGSGRWLANMARVAGIKFDDVTLINTIQCVPPNNWYPTDEKSRSYISLDGANQAIQHCGEQHLWPAVHSMNFSRIYAIGGQALTALTGKTGISSWRGSPLPLLWEPDGTRGSSPKVIGAIHPAALMRQAKLTSVTVGDLRKCLPKGTRVLTEDLQWKPIEAFIPGDKLVGVDEYTNHKRGRGFCESQVEAIEEITEPCYKIVTTKGTIVSSAKHGWLCKQTTGARKGRWEWINAEELKPGRKINYLGDTWEPIDNHEASYLQGFLDGEGYISDQHFGFNQNEGIVQDQASAYCKTLGFDIVSKTYPNAPSRIHAKDGYKRKELTYNTFRGSTFDILKAVGTLRPIRILKDSKRFWVDKRISSTSGIGHAIVLSVEYIGEQPVIALQTSSKTFIAEGYVSHNSAIVPPEHYNLFPTLEDVSQFKSTKFAFDLEWDRHGITHCGLSDSFYRVIVVPWQDGFIQELRRIFEGATEIIGHNIINADLPWLESLGWDFSRVSVQDTMLKQHLIQPDLPHGLDFVASVFTQKVFWKGKGWEEEVTWDGDAAPKQQWRTWDRADALPRELGGYGGCLSSEEAFALYNARDTDAEYQINTPLTQQLAKWGLTSLYENVSRPAGYICREMGMHGLKVDTSQLVGIRSDIDLEITRLEAQLPDGLRPYTRDVVCNLPAPPGTYRPIVRKCKGSKTLGTQHESIEIIFTVPGDLPCPTCRGMVHSGKMVEAKIIKGTRTETVAPYNSQPGVQAYVDGLSLAKVINRKTGNATTGKQARSVWVKAHPEFGLLGALKKQVTLRNNFAKDSILEAKRIYFNLKVHGTAEGRLSCTGGRDTPINIQNQPKAFRKIYVPDDPSWGFVNIDLSQGESWLTCWFAKDWAKWEKLQDKSYDEHSEIASAIFGRPVTKALASHDDTIDALRQIGKKTNHASNYGMGYLKFHEILSMEGFDIYTPADAKHFLETWKVVNAPIAKWQRETIQTQERQGYLRNPFGRIRWFSSQAAATECLAFLPASTLADMVLRMMIAHYPTKYSRELENLGVGVAMNLMPEWIMSIQVHDSIVLQGPWKDHIEQEERSKMIMTQKFRELDGFQFRVDIKSSDVNWGSC